MLVYKVLISFALVQGYLALGFPEIKDISFKESNGRLASKNAENCEDLLDPELVDKIASYQETADKIIDFIVNGDFKGKSYNELVEFVDRYPTRLSGEKTLEDSIDYMMGRMKDLGLHNVRGEQVLVPHWVRYVTLIKILN